MKPEEKARLIIDKQIYNSGWDICDREDYIHGCACAVREALMQGNDESDYLFFIDDKAIAVLEAKREENLLGDDVGEQAENYAYNPQSWYGMWENYIPLVYLANGKKTLFKNLLVGDTEYKEINRMHSPKEMLRLISGKSEFGALPRIEKSGLRECQYNAQVNFEKSLRSGKRKSLVVLATGAGKTYLACLASYRLLNYTPVRRVLFLADRNNLARQAKSEFSSFDRTENGQELSSIYTIEQLRHEDDINADIVISTIQKLYAVLTGAELSEQSEDLEDEKNTESEEQTADENITLGATKLPVDYFQFIVVDECHRSIYGKWKAVLDYFKNAIVLGLTATPTDEAYAFFNSNIIEEYTYDQSVNDGVNVPYRIFRIETEKTEHGGAVRENTNYTETTNRTGRTVNKTADERTDYSDTDLDRSITNTDQIRTVLQAYKDSIYTELYPEREPKWEYIPKTLIFAKDDYHATVITEIAKEVFGCEFEGGKVPDKFVQKITYSSDDSNWLIRELRTEKEFRIAVTVTLVATGTDVKPLEVVLFMKDVHSTVLYTQMKGRGCRTISEDKLREVTPNADFKELFYLVDAVGVTESEKNIPIRVPGGGKKKLTLEQLLEHLAHNDLSDENLMLLRDYCSTINGRYEHNRLFGYHLDEFIKAYGFSPKNIADRILKAYDDGFFGIYPFISPSHDNNARYALIACLMDNLGARKMLLELQKGYHATTDEDPDTLISASFSVEDAKQHTELFEKYINDNKDRIEALRIIYNSEDTPITNTMLTELKTTLLGVNRGFNTKQLWREYKRLDKTGSVDEYDIKDNTAVLTDLIQIVRYAYRRTERLTSLLSGFNGRFALYCGQAQRELSDAQTEIMREIAEYIIHEGVIWAEELNEIDTDLWRRAVTGFSTSKIDDEIAVMAKFILKAA